MAVMAAKEKLSQKAAKQVLSIYWGKVTVDSTASHSIHIPKEDWKGDREVGTGTGAEVASGDEDMNRGDDDGLRPSLEDDAKVGVNILGDEGDKRLTGATAAAAAEGEGAGNWLGPREEGRSGRHLTVTKPVGSDKNHSERWRIRSVCLW